jgi:hypothetical protein
VTDDDRGLVDLRYEIDDDWCEHCGVRLSVRPCGCGPTGYDEDAERIALRGTSLCTGDCAPMCDWCLAAHECPTACGGGDACPYVGLERGRA